MPMWALALMQFLSVLPQLIQAVEAAFGEKRGQGAAKKDAVLATVNAAADVAVAAGVPELADPKVRAAVSTAASSLTDALVAGFNAADAWKPRPPES